MTPEEGTLIAGKYRLKHMLDKGGMGHIWLAEHAELAQQVAVKLVTEELADDESVRIRFKREAKSAAQLKSPHICHIYDFGMQEGVAYIVMELLVGEDLRDRLRRVHRIPLERCVELCQELCDGLAAAHEVGIIHRDLKPGNIFLSNVRGKETLKIVDFGIAKETHSELVVGENTTTGMLIGSPRYMSPEQATGKPLDTRSDLWSASVVLYQALTGERPFRGDHLGHIISEICAGEVDPPTAITGDLPISIDMFFERAFARKLDVRFATAEEMADAFARAAGGEPIARSAPPPRPELQTFPDELPFPTVLQPPDHDGTTRRMPSRSEDATTPGVGIDTTKARTRPWGLALAFAALALTMVLVIALTGDEDPAPAAPTKTATPEPTPAPSPAPIETSAPTATATASASARSAPPPVIARPRPTKVKPPPKPKTDPLFGLPEKKN